MMQDRSNAQSVDDLYLGESIFAREDLVYWKSLHEQHLPSHRSSSSAYERSENYPDV